MNQYRTHTCGELREVHVGQIAKLSGWVETIRDHGGVRFLDIRDQYGVTQIVLHDDEFKTSRESVVTVSGTVKKRAEETVNPKLGTGTVEVHADTIVVQSKACPRPAVRSGRVQEYQGGGAPSSSFSGFEKPCGKGKHFAAGKGDRLSSRKNGGAWFYGNSNPDFDFLLPGGGAGLSGSQPKASGQILRASAGSADFQTAPDGFGIRPLFSDCALLSGRGCPCGSFPGGILPTGFRDGICRTGRRSLRGGDGASRCFQDFFQKSRQRPPLSAESPTPRQC